MKSIIKIAFILLISFSIFFNNLSAQNQMGQLKGVVIDADDESPLPNANIYLLKLKTGVATDRNGEFIIKNIPVGEYEINCSYVGYMSQSIKLEVTKYDKKGLVIKLQADKNDLGKVVVLAKSKARQLREQAMPVSVISMNQLQGTVSNVQDVLAKTAGVTIRSSGGVGADSRVSIHGLEGKRIGFFLDENPLTDHSDFIDINDIPVEMIDRIEVYKGIVPAKFGGSAVGGAVNIVLREYPPRYIDANYTFGSYNTHKASIVTKRNIAQEGIEFGLGGVYTYSDNDYKMKSPFVNDLIIKRDHDQFKKITIGGSLKARKWWFDLIELEPVFINTYKQIQGIEYNIQEAHTKSNVFLLANKLEKENFFLEGLEFDFSLAYAFTKYHFIDTASHRYTWDMKQYNPVSIYGGEIGQWASNSDNIKHTLVSKLNLNYVIDNNNSINFNSVSNYAHSLPKDELKEKVIGYKTEFSSNMFSWTSGLSYDYRTDNDKLLNSINLKYYYYSINTKLASIMSQIPENIDMTKHDFGINNSFRYRLFPDLMAKISASYDVRLPSENELLGDGYIIEPAGNLEPERNTSFNLGLLFDLTGKSDSNLQIEINAFYSYLKNMIRFTGGYLRSQYQNFGEMRTLGIDAEIKADITKWLYGYANATYQDLRDTRKLEPHSQVPNPTKGDRMPNIPYLMANAGLEFHKENIIGGKGQNTRLFVDGSFVDKYFYDFEQSRLQERRIPQTISFNAGLEHSIMNGTFYITLRINNLTDTEMMSEFNRPLPGRNFGIRLRCVLK